jgi:bacillithiol biosynthesis cysteine-adding enzyme BshC
MLPVFEDELLNHRSAKLVAQTTAELEKQYKVQAGGREINLFYFDEDLRERIEAKADGFAVANSTIQFSKEQMLKELKEYPERFSPNVILRGLYQETILPNIAFIGGGGELAYWLELKAVFENYKVPFPVLILRNSFLVAEEQWNKKISKLGFTMADFFLPEQELLNLFVNREAGKKLKLNGAFAQAEELYTALKQQAEAIDSTLSQHVDALKTKAIYRLQELEKKLLRAEKRKFTEQQKQIQHIRQNLFPGNGLQERKESFLSFYATYGRGFIAQLHQHSLALEQEFIVLTL